MKNIKKLMRSNGILLLLEATKPPLWFDLVFGMLKGWWAFSDTQTRKHHALLNYGKWKEVLESQGFTHVGKINDRDDDAESLHTLIISNAPVPEKLRQDAGIRSPDTPHDVLLFSNQTDAINRLAALLKNYGDVTEAVLPDERIRETIREFIQKNAEDIHIVYAAEDTGDTTNNCHTLLTIVQELLRQAPGKKARLTVITRGCHSLDNDKPINLKQTPIWGFTRSVMNECPQLSARIIDIPDRAIDEDISLLCDVVINDSVDDELLIRNGKLYSHFLARTRIVNAFGPSCGHFTLRHEHKCGICFTEQPDTGTSATAGCHRP